MTQSAVNPYRCIFICLFARIFAITVGATKSLQKMKKEPLLAFKQRTRITKIEQSVVTCRKGQDRLLPQVTMSPTDLFHGQTGPGVFDGLGHFGGDQSELNPATRSIPLSLRIQMMLNQGRDDFDGNAFNTSDGTCEKACIDPDDRGVVLSFCRHLKILICRLGSLNV